MNKLIISLAALAALSSAALASARTDIDPRDRMPAAGVSSTMSEAAPLLVALPDRAKLEERRLEEKNNSSSR